ncbi:hypothetical protein X777_06533 [Ooceraea biroi]|uniref:Uncharacterized protein n=1 Tax=Ooceraea biroi TaxID=2015173 RepID=A0A026WBJ0_OOCBI|nr:hypothetical protein X777_06533 [Ooceraea biroi]
MKVTSLELLYYKRCNPPSFWRRSFSLGCGFYELANYEYDYLSDVLLTGSQTCPGGVTLHPFSPPQRILTWRPSVCSP